MKRIRYKHAYNYFHLNNLSDLYQAGFLPEHSSKFLVILQNIDEGKFSCMFLVICQKLLIECGILFLFLTTKLWLRC